MAPQRKAARGMGSSCFGRALWFALTATVCISTGCEQYYIGESSEPSEGSGGIRGAQANHGSAKAGSSESEVNETVAGAQGSGGANNDGAGGTAENTEIGGSSAPDGQGGNEGGRAGDGGSTLEPIDAAPELIQDCTIFCDKESAVKCEYTIPNDVCIRLCTDPTSMLTPGSSAEDLRLFFDCAKDKVLMCNDSTGRPEATNCTDEQVYFNRWILGNQFQGDAGYY